MKRFCSDKATLSIHLVTLQNTVFFYQVFSWRKRNFISMYGNRNECPLPRLKRMLSVHCQGCLSLRDPRLPLVEVWLQARQVRPPQRLLQHLRTCAFVNSTSGVRKGPRSQIKSVTALLLVCCRRQRGRSRVAGWKAPTCEHLTPQAKTLLPSTLGLHCDGKHLLRAADISLFCVILNFKIPSQEKE